MDIELTLDRIENDQAVLKTSDNQEIIWPLDKLPADAHEGQALNCRLTKLEDKEKADQAVAKNILNEILDTKN